MIPVTLEYNFDLSHFDDLKRIGIDIKPSVRALQLSYIGTSSAEAVIMPYIKGNTTIGEPGLIGCAFKGADGCESSAVYKRAYIDKSHTVMLQEYGHKTTKKYSYIYNTLNLGQLDIIWFNPNTKECFIAAIRGRELSKLDKGDVLSVCGTSFVEVYGTPNPGAKYLKSTYFRSTYITNIDFISLVDSNTVSLGYNRADGFYEKDIPEEVQGEIIKKMLFAKDECNKKIKDLDFAYIYNIDINLDRTGVYGDAYRTFPEEDFYEYNRIVHVATRF